MTECHPMVGEAGTYLLMLKCCAQTQVQIGRWGELDLVRGYYVYVGSAFGPGGIKARVLRHCRSEKTYHWHIDYLREHVHFLGCWYRHDQERLEHRWAQMLARMEGLTVIPKFGSSDCRCASHLFHTATKPDFLRFSQIAGGNMEQWDLSDSTGKGAI